MALSAYVLSKLGDAANGGFPLDVPSSLCPLSLGKVAVGSFCVASNSWGLMLRGHSILHRAEGSVVSYFLPGVLTFPFFGRATNTVHSICRVFPGV